MSRLLEHPRKHIPGNTISFSKVIKCLGTKCLDLRLKVHIPLCCHLATVVVKCMSILDLLSEFTVEAFTVAEMTFISHSDIQIDMVQLSTQDFVLQ